MFLKMPMIREMQQSDGPRILEIYKLGQDTRNATFENQVPSWQDWDSKHISHSRFVYEEEGQVLGWAALSPVSSREVYKGVAEVSIYIDTDYKGKGIGTKLMEYLIKSSEENSIWTLFSSIFPENVATLKLHEKFGFRIIGTREKIAQHYGKWRDTVILERRSKKVGIN
jgi:phosphinothricin acetyltransferase